MPDQFTVLLDAPGVATKRMPIARLGEYEDKRYGKFAITKDDVSEWQKNLDKLPGGRALIDFDHLANKPSPHRNTEAAGWITGIDLEGEQAYGTVDWTPKGEAAVKDKRYLFASPTYGPYTDDSGATFANTLTGAALTNKPFLTSMPQITLASDEAIQHALELDPQAAVYQKALDGEYGDEAQALALAQASPEDAAVTDAISSAGAAIAKAISAQAADPDKTDPNDQAVLRSLRRAASSIDDAEAAQARDVAGEKSTSMLELDETGEIVELDMLSTKARNDLKDGDFALPGRRYPIQDLAHARNALARVAQNGSPDEQAKVKAAVYRRYPALKPAAKNLHTSDSPAQMEFTADILKELGVDDDAKVAEILALEADAQPAAVKAALSPEPAPEKTLEELADEKGVKILSAEDHEALDTAAKEGADAKRQLEERDGNEPTKSLEELAAEAGHSLIDPAKLTELEQSANKVVALETAVTKLRTDAEDREKELEAERFETAYQKAEAAGKAVPAQKERWQGFFALDAENTLTMLEELPVSVNMRARGANVQPLGEDVPVGHDAEHHALDQKVTAYMQEHEGVDYFKALEAISGVTVPGMVA